jgi:hypothetical protein
MRILLLLLMFTLPVRAADVVEVGSAAGMVFGRDAVTAYLSIKKDGNSLTVDTDNRIRNYLRGVFELDGKAHILVYNTAENVPSGRALSRGEEGNDVLVVTELDGVAKFQRVTSLPVGIDIQMRVSEVRGGKIICGDTACLIASTSWFSEPEYSVTRMPPHSEIVELAGAYVLLQKKYDDQFDGRELPAADVSIFSVCEVSNTIDDCVDVPSNIIPFDLKSDGAYSEMTDPEVVLRFDYNRLGLANYSEPNLEARIAWSNVYFLTGLSNLHSMPISADFRQEIERRLHQEFDALARLAGTAYPEFKVRRYSVDREPVDFLLHLSRIAKPAHLARQIIGSELTDQVLSSILPEIRNPSSTVETLAAKPRDQLQYRKFMPFWADGVNTPWNFQSAWIEALALTGIPDSLRAPVRAMISHFLADERLVERPKNWTYASGLIDNGWSDGRSSNTPLWSGHQDRDAPAHISYRSMDALAVLAAGRAGVPIPSYFQDYVSGLISRGYLYPFVSDGLDNQPDVPFAIARHYARSSLPWHFQNQVWAFNSLRRM